jgi:hypothetical protein
MTLNSALPNTALKMGANSAALHLRPLARRKAYEGDFK